MKNELPLARPMTAVAMPNERAMIRYGAAMPGFWRRAWSGGLAQETGRWLPPRAYSSTRSGRGWPIEPTSATSRLNGRPTVQSTTARILRAVPGIWLMWYVRAIHQAGNPENVNRPSRPTAL